MSRTYNTKPVRLRYPEFCMKKEDKYNIVPYVRCYLDPITGEEKAYKYHVWMKKPGIFPKKKKCDDYEYRWMTTPMWWCKVMMNRPQRKAGKRWERQVVQQSIESLNYTDTPSISRKPHVYYW